MAPINSSHDSLQRLFRAFFRLATIHFRTDRQMNKQSRSIGRPLGSKMPIGGQKTVQKK